MVWFEQVMVEGPGDHGRHDHDKDHGQAHTDGAFHFVGNAKKRAQSEKADQEYIIDYHGRKKNEKELLHAVLSFLSNRI